jgi:hypothetical protein
MATGVGVSLRTAIIGGMLLRDLSQLYEKMLS